MPESWDPFGLARREAETNAAGDEPSARPSATLSRFPPRQLAILTCMDARLDPVADLELARGDAVVMRNGGALVTEDVLRSLGLAVDNLGVQEVLLLGHTECAAQGGDVEAVRASLADGLAAVGSAFPQLRVRAGVYSMVEGTVERVERPS